MTTNEFIKLLQAEDPTGEAHIRLEGGTPTVAWRKEGYFDGYYSYVDKDDNFVTSTMGYKVDIYCMDIDAFVDRHFDACNRDWEAIKAKFVFEFDNYDEDNKQIKIEHILQQAKNSFDELVEIYNYIG